VVYLAYLQSIKKYISSNSYNTKSLELRLIRRISLGEEAFLVTSSTESRHLGVRRTQIEDLVCCYIVNVWKNGSTFIIWNIEMFIEFFIIVIIHSFCFYFFPIIISVIFFQETTTTMKTKSFLYGPLDPCNLLINPSVFWIFNRFKKITSESVCGEKIRYKKK
jgi:hypothetical protein